VRAPDGAFLTKAHLARSGSPKGYFEGAPDMVIEIVSPGDRAKDIREKVELWLHGGAAMVVVLHPGRCTSAVHTVTGTRTLPPHGELEFGSLIPGLSIPLDTLFAEG
jgi:Uma2 family endonuclease